jgi:hypothetical protein
MASYTLAPWKVLWPEVGHTVRAGVCGPKVSGVVVPDHTIVAVSCESHSQAYFISALLNSSPAQAAVRGYIVLHPSPHVLEHIAIPQFSPENKQHVRLAELAERCHAATAKGDTKTVFELELRIDSVAARLWGITDDELKATREDLARTRGRKEPDGDKDEA